MHKLSFAGCAAALAMAVTASAAIAQDVVKAAPGTSRVIFENQYIRVVRSHFAPGATEAAHTHPAGWYYVTQGGALVVAGADGRSSTWTVAAGEGEWSDGEAPHTARNAGHAPMEYLLIEVKAAPTQTPNP